MRQAFSIWKALLILLIFIPGKLDAQEYNITGKVTEKTDGESMPGVYVVIKGTNAGAVTDANGNYALKVPDANATLVFSFLGFITQEIPVGPNRVINVALEQDIQLLEEIVVIGYGTVKKSDATGSVAVVSSDDFNKGSIVSPQQLIVGKSAGVVVTNGNGAPGSGSTIRIRGGSSMSASNDPLIVIDGVPLDNNGPSGMGNSLSMINPNDIESMTVLKDASATAIYGSRASNGVIMITTKKGASKFRVAYNGNMSVNTVPKTLDVMSANEFRALISELYGSTSEQFDRLGPANTDWQKEIYRTSISTDHNLSVSGTYKVLPYRASVGYTNDNGILKTSNFSRTTVAVGLNPSMFDDHLKVNLNVKGMFTDTRFANEGAVGSALTFDPTHPVKDATSANGYFYWKDNGGNPIKIATSNPVAQLELTQDLANVLRSVGNIQFDYKLHFLPDLHANLNLGYDYSESDGTVDVPESASWTYDPVNGGGIKRAYDQKRKNTLLDFYLNYVKELESLSSKIDLTAGYSWQHFWREGSTYETNVAESVVNTDQPYETENYLISFFGRMNYTLLDKYLLTFTLRDDGSSRFAEENRWGLFPSVALAWKINSESFLKNSNLISDLKLRLGYGITGQQDVTTGDFPYLAQYTLSDDYARYRFGTTYYNTYRPEGYDKNIKWEETTTYNAGLDFGFLQNRITGTIDVYSRETKDLINTIPVPAGSNLTNKITTNVGNLTNKGVEFTINGKVISTSDLTWELAYNIGYNENKITKLTQTDDPSYQGVATGGISGGVGSNIQIHSVDYPVFSYYVYQQVYDEQGNPIEGLYVDRKADGVLNSSDLYRYKKPAADVLMGISSSLNYKNWDFSFAGRFSFGNYIYNNVTSTRGTYLDAYNPGLNYTSNVLTSSTDTKFSSAQYFSDYYVENGSFFRMDNISLGYRFKNLIQSKINLHVGAVVQNAFVITKYTGLDPEIFGGIDNNIYPRPRIFMLGVNVEF
ncbi:MAG: TonB-dependent receptor [Bacteroidales bacterium]|nr:TonB-dependent receptor [Bacteroidales bacterium]